MIVVDEQGNEYESTYLRRAKGLVKNGRARFVEEDKICLACPPVHMMEENDMADNIISKWQIVNEIAELRAALGSIERILGDIRYINSSQNYVESDEGETIPLEFSAEAAFEQVQTIREVALAREETIRQMLDFFISVYQELKDAGKE